MNENLLRDTTINAENAEIAEFETRFDGRPERSRPAIWVELESADKLVAVVCSFICRSEFGPVRRFATPSNRHASR